MINIGTTIGRHKYAANMQQIIAAIDQLKGTTDWRAQRVNDLVGTGKSAGLGMFGKVRPRTYLADQASLTCIADRKHADAIVEAALAGGAPGANVSYARLIEAESQETAGGIRFNRERGIVRSILPEDLLTNVVLRIQSVCGEQDADDVCIYSQPVTRAITYIADEAGRTDVVLGGGTHPHAPGGG